MSRLQRGLTGLNSSAPGNGSRLGASLAGGERQGAKSFEERRGKMERTEVKFRDNEHLLQIIDRIVSKVGRRVDETSPMVDARLPDGSRVNAIIPPLALDGASVSIRRFGTSPLRVEDLLRLGAMPRAVMDFFAAAVKARCNILISGGTGS